MPTVSTNRTVDNRRPVKSPPAQSESKLRPITPAETDVWAAALRNQSSSNFEFIDLDEPYEYPFKVCDFFFGIIQTCEFLFPTFEGPRSCLGTHKRR